MGFNNILKTARTLFGHMVIHPFVLICTLWMSGALVALVTNESKSIELSFVTIGIASKWGNWLIHSWTQLSFNAYDYLKIKLILALISPPAIVIMFYIKNFTRIRSLEFFKAKESVFGSTDWATASDIDRAGLRAKHGMLLGQDSMGYFIADGFQHSLLFAPTGSGKGVRAIA
jgi:type IV secretion system protein VirD4